MNVLPVCVYICMYVSMYACTLVQAFGGQKKMSDPLELKLQMVVSHQVLGTKPGSLQEQEVSLATHHLSSTHHGFLPLLMALLPDTAVRSLQTRLPATRIMLSLLCCCW